MRPAAVPLLALLSLVPVLPACDDVEPAEDGLDDSFLGDGKADAFGVVDGSPTALGVLLVANRSSADELRAAGVSTAARTALVARRPVATLRALDEVPYVGVTAFSRLRTAATARGWTAASFYQRTDDRYAGYQMIRRLDGSVASVAKHFDGPVSFIFDLGTGLQKIARLSDGHLVPRSATFVEDRAGRLYAAGTTPRTDGKSVLSLVRITESALRRDRLPEPGVESLWLTVPDRVSTSVSAAVDGAGDVHVLYASGDQGGNAIYLRSFAAASTAATPSSEERLLTADFPSSVAHAIAVDGDQLVVAATDSRTARVTIFRGRPGAWSSAATTLPSFAQRLQLTSSAGRTILAVTMRTPQGGSTASLFEVTGTTLAPVGPAPSLIAPTGYVDGRLDLLVHRDRGLVVRIERRLHRREPDSFGRLQPADVVLGRLLGEDDDYAGQALDAQPWLDSALLATGEIAFIAPTPFQPYVTYGRTRGAPLAWRDASRGAGSLEFDRDPCLFAAKAGSNLLAPGVTESSAGVTLLTIAAGTTYTVPAGSCVHVDRVEGAGELILAGTAAAPVHLLGTGLRVDRVRASYAFFADSPRPSPAWASNLDVDSLGEGFGQAAGALDHVSVARRHNVLRRAVPSAIVGTIYALGAAGLPAPRQLVVTASDFGPLAGDALAPRLATRLEIRDSRFHDLAGAAVILTNGGLDDAALVIERSAMERVEAGVRLLAITSAQRAEELADLRDRAPATHAAVLARLGGAAQPVATPVALRELVVTGPELAPAKPEPGILLVAPTGTLDAVEVVGASSDGVRIVDAGLLSLRGGRFVENGGHGIAVAAEPPRGLGPCYQPPPGGGPPSSPNPGPDPAVLDALIEDNAGAGIFVSGPHIPMTVIGNHIRRNLGPGFVIDSGRGVSGQMFDPGCPSGFRDAGEVDLPLAGDSQVTGNDLVGNGVDDDGLELRSDHRLGTLPITGNYWGVAASAAAERFRCTAACLHAPARSAPIP